MEEYDANINFHFIVFDNGQIELTSDVDEDFEYFSETERTVIIVSLLTDLFKQVYNNLDDLDINSNKYQEKILLGSELRDTLIKAIINIQYNLLADKTNKENCILEFAMATYKSMFNKLTKDTVNFVEDTYYSDEIGNLEPINGALAFILDTAESLLENNIPKHIIKPILKTMIDQQYKCIEDYIDNWEQDED